MKSMNMKIKLLMAAVTGLLLIGLLLTGCSGYNPTTSQVIQTTSNQPSQTSDVPSQTSSISSKTTTISPTITPPTTTSTTAKNESVSISVDKQQVNQGDTFTITIVINSKIASRGAQASLSFDPSAMQCETVTEGSFYKDWATANGVTTTMVPSEPAIDNTQGTVDTVAVAIMGQTQAEQAGQTPGGAQGPGIFLSYQMTAKSASGKQSAIKVSNVILMDANGDPIDNVDISNGQVTIGTP